MGKGIPGSIRTGFDGPPAAAGQEADLALELSYYNLKQMILTYGMDIMVTPEFQQAFLQEHHYHTTVAEHSINVAVTGLILCILLKYVHVDCDPESVVQAALCHDLGIMGREKKYRSEFECCMRHPLESVEVARRILPDCSDRTLTAIETHMWPARPGCPKSVEGFVVTIADKHAAIMECAHRTTSYHCRHIDFQYVIA